MKFGFVILNYLAWETTVNCIESIKKLRTDDQAVFITVVDNGSSNDSFERLSELYSDNSNVDVLSTKKNLGFANGNNFGYKHIKEKYDPDYIIMCNDDILFPDDGLYSWIIKCYEKYQFAVLGPDIYSTRGEFHQSPNPNFTRNLKRCYRMLLLYDKNIAMLSLKKILRKNIEYKPVTWENSSYESFSDQLTLHGAFQIFSRDYFAEYDEPYYHKTFLYREEDILKLRCDNTGLKMIYSPDYMVYHLQAVSTLKVGNTGYKYKLFRLKHERASLKVYIGLLKDS